MILSIPTRPTVLDVAPYTAKKTITGITYDNAGNVLGGVRVELQRARDGMVVDQGVSAADGNYSLDATGAAQGTPENPGYQVDAYLSGSPDRAGTTVNTLQGQ